MLHVWVIEKAFACRSPAGALGRCLLNQPQSHQHPCGAYVCVPASPPGMGVLSGRHLMQEDVYGIFLSRYLSSDCNFVHVLGFPRSHRCGVTREKKMSSLGVISTTEFALHFAHRLASTAVVFACCDPSVLRQCTQLSMRGIFDRYDIR
jgi:hypothetical protein